MRKLLLWSVFCIGMTLSIGCDEGFEELNTNPNDPITVPSGLLIADVVFTTGNSLYSTFVGGDMGSCWAQHWGKVQYNDEERYIPREGVIETTVWKSLYEDVVSDSRTMQLLAEAEGNANMQGVALVMQAYGYSLLTDMFGNIPFSDAIKASEGNFTPAYDSQEAVYTGILAMLDQADQLLAEDGGTINNLSDILYHGDWSKWEKFANSLKFRCLMRISGKKDVSADLKALMNRNMFTSNDDEAKLVYLSANPSANPLYETIVFGTRGEHKMNSKLVDMLAETNDPRLEVYAQPNADGEYRGKPAGIEDLPNDTYNYDNVSAIGTFYLQPETPAYFVAYSELLFLMAEAANRGLIDGTPSDLYEQAIAASFAANDLSAADAATYLAQGSVAYSAANGLRQIGEQKWIALFCQGVEAWTEWRRTGFPALQPALEGAISEIPSRYTYPSIEQSVNKAAYEAAVAAQGANLLTTKVWWDN